MSILNSNSNTKVILLSSAQVVYNAVAQKNVIQDPYKLDLSGYRFYTIHIRAYSYDEENSSSPESELSSGITIKSEAYWRSSYNASKGIYDAVNPISSTNIDTSAPYYNTDWITVKAPCLALYLSVLDLGENSAVKLYVDIIGIR